MIYDPAPLGCRPLYLRLPEAVDLAREEGGGGGKGLRWPRYRDTRIKDRGRRAWRRLDPAAVSGGLRGPARTPFPVRFTRAAADTV